MQLYKITLTFGVHSNSYHVAAEGYDAAVAMVVAVEAPEMSVKSIEPVADFGPDEFENFLVSNDALALLTGN